MRPGLHEAYDMTGASQAGTGEDRQLQLASPLEQWLDAAVESERSLSVIARRARDRAAAQALTALGPTPAGLAVGPGSDARGGARPTQPGQRSASEVSGWLQACAVALGVVALLTAFLGPVSPTLLRGPSADVAKRDLTQVDADRTSRAPLPAPLDPGRGAAARATLDLPAQRLSAVSAAPSPSEPSRSSAAPAAQPAPAGVAHVSTEKRAKVVTVDDLFGVGGDEPLPPEALETPAPAAPPPARTGKRAHSAPISSALFYQKAPF